MALLDQNQAVFYLPLDDKWEELLGTLWNQGAYGYFPGAILANGFTTSSNQKAYLCFGADMYLPPENADNLTVAVWIRNANEYPSDWGVGWGDSPYPTIVKNGIRIYQGGSHSTSFSACASGTNVNWNNVSTTHSADSFCVFRLEWSGGQVSGFFSINGAAFASMGSPQTLPKMTFDGADVAFIYDRTGGATLQVFDELALWINSPRPTTTQLQNMYNLAGGAHRLSEYTDTYNAVPKASGVLPLFSRAYARGSGLMPLYTRSAYYASGQMPLYTIAWGAASGEMPLYTDGIAASSGFMPLYMHSAEAQNRNLFLKVDTGHVSGVLPLTMYGAESGTDVLFASGGIPLFLDNDGGVSLATAIRPLFMKAGAFAGPMTELINRSVFLKVRDTHASGNLDVFLKVPEPAEGDLSLLVRGSGAESSEGYTPISASRAIFMRCYDGETGDLPLYMHAVEWPTGTCPAYLFGVEGSVSGICPALLAGYKTCASAIPMLMWGVSGVESGLIPLYMGYATGVLSGHIPMYTHGY